MHQLNTRNSDMIVYYGDVNLENFVYNQNERRVKVIDLEYVIIVERHLFSDTNVNSDYKHSQGGPLNSNIYCRRYFPDYNVEQICRYVLSPSNETNQREMSSDFLHSIPASINRQWNLTNIIAACAQTGSTSERLVLYEQLLKILSQIICLIIHYMFFFVPFKAPWADVSYRRLARQAQSHEGRHENNTSATIKIDRELDVTDFLTEIDSIRLLIDKLDEVVQSIKKVQMDMLQSTENSKFGKDLDTKNDEIKKLSYQVSTMLRKMEQANDTHDKQSAQGRIRESQIFVLTRRLREVMIQHNLNTVAHRERCKKIIVHELNLSGQGKTNDELEQILESGIAGGFSYSLMLDTHQAKLTLNAIEARQRDIIKLENCIKELHNMFLDLATLVTDQGEMIDCIEHNVSKAIDYVEVAHENVNIAEQNKRKANKKKIIIIIILFAIFLVILVTIFISYFAQKKFEGR
ncbi:unnamed protein product [Rotaria socialis]|uniref:t-SNARE coiled-coil homology domain-containing protein n=1 Tax=Rotaria socialis TaxID=392032 RepID=A0A820QX70_9BILA|nr:unnamed protein product [Rotaria socialis]CAF4431386.1 unnamed protein product [Rotaria socialis]CAF4527454.1 unnamed protein product [Rotaria socialis]